MFFGEIEQLLNHRRDARERVGHHVEIRPGSINILGFFPNPGDTVEQAVEGVVDLVGYAGRKGADGRELLGLDKADVGPLQLLRLLLDLLL